MKRSRSTFDVNVNATTIVVAGATVVGLYLFAKHEAKQGVEAVGDAASSVGGAVNPTSQDNIFNRAFESLGAAISGDPDWSLGSKIYEWTHDEPAHQNGPVTTTPETGSQIPPYLLKEMGTSS